MQEHPTRKLSNGNFYFDVPETICSISVLFLNFRTSQTILMSFTRSRMTKLPQIKMSQHYSPSKNNFLLWSANVYHNMIKYHFKQIISSMGNLFPKVKLTIFKAEYMAPNTRAKQIYQSQCRIPSVIIPIFNHITKSTWKNLPKLTNKL